MLVLQCSLVWIHATLDRDFLSDQSQSDPEKCQNCCHFSASDTFGRPSERSAAEKQNAQHGISCCVLAWFSLQVSYESDQHFGQLADFHVVKLFLPSNFLAFSLFSCWIQPEKNQHGVNCSYHIMMIMMKFWFACFWFLPNTSKAKRKKFNLIGGIVKQPQRLCFWKTACSFPWNGLRHSHFSPHPTLVTIYLLEYFESFDSIVINNLSRELRRRRSHAGAGNLQVPGNMHLFFLSSSSSICAKGSDLYHRDIVLMFIVQSTCTSWRHRRRTAAGSSSPSRRSLELKSSQAFLPAQMADFHSYFQTGEKTALYCLTQHDWKLDIALDNYFANPEAYYRWVSPPGSHSPPLFREPRTAVDRKKLEQLYNRYKVAYECIACAPIYSRVNFKC